MIISAFTAIILAIPVLILGEKLVKKIYFLDKFNIPIPIAGGLVVSLIIFCLNLSGVLNISFNTKVDTPWWTWLVTIEPIWVTRPLKEVTLPFMVAFFTCVGLNASWDLVKRGSVLLLMFFGLACVLAIVQNFVGIFMAKIMCQPSLLGLTCGSASLMGGHGTVLGFADLFRRLGLEGADTIGVAAATFGLVAGSLTGGPIAVSLIKKYNLKLPSVAKDMHKDSGLEEDVIALDPTHSKIIKDIVHLFGKGWSFIGHSILLLVLLKAGAWVSYFIQQTGVTFPVYIGSMILGVTIRNLLDGLGKHWINSETVDALGSVNLMIFLAIAIMTINLAQLMASAIPMLTILGVQVVVAVLFCLYVVPAVLGKTYEIAVMSAGMIGFGLGATSNAIANMRALVDHYGPAPQAFLIVSVVGAFLIDFVNAINITVFTNLFK